MIDERQNTAVVFCRCCGEEIYRGEKVYRGSEGNFHTECIGNFLRDRIDEDDAFAAMVAAQLDYEEIYI